MQSQKMTIDIFYIATGVYSEYFLNFLETLPLFFPGIKKRITVISDNLKEYDGFKNEEIEIKVHFQLNMPYPIIPLTKTFFIEAYMPKDAEYVFYFDADTLFIEKEPEYWNELLDRINENEIISSIHPGGHYPGYKISEDSLAYIPKGAGYYSIISSLYGGKKEEILKFCGQIKEKITNDLTKHVNGHQEHYIPPLFDQDYMNRVVFESNGLSFCLRCFVLIKWLKNDLDVTEENFVEQKYNISIKFKQKNML